MPIEDSTELKAFVVHGQDKAARTRLELILHRIGATPITLRKAPKEGKTWIELLEEHLPAADAVVVLMTPDDEGRAVGGKSLTPRVRENVLVEAGYAVINRRKRSVLIALGGVSIPSDFDGIARIEKNMMDKSVEVELAKRLAEMGLPVNVTAAI